MVAQFRGQLTKELGEGAEPPPAGAAPWNYFFDLLRPEMPFESGSKPRRTLRSPLEVVSNPISGRRGPLEVVPSRFPGCATPHARSLAVPPPSARMLAVATNIVIF